MAVDAVTIAHDKQMEALLTTHVWCKSVSILIDLVGVSRLVAAGGGKGKLRDGVESFSLTCCRAVAFIFVRIRILRCFIRGLLRGLVCVFTISASDAVLGRDTLWNAAAIKRALNSSFLPAVLVSLTRYGMVINISPSTIIHMTYRAKF